jgi:CRP/FNR family transcriptional regulator, anaerobic regulatory protein
MAMEKAFSFKIPAPCETCYAPQHRLCWGLPHDQQSALRGIARWRLVPEGQPIFDEGDGVLAFASILKGVVKLSKADGGGKQCAVALMYPPEFLGYSFGKTHWSSASAATEVELCTYPAEPFRRLAEEIPELNKRMFRIASHQLDLARDWLSMLNGKPSYQRVAGLFASIATRGRLEDDDTPEPNSAEFVLPLSRPELACFLGLTHETVSRNITKLREKGLIELRTAREAVVPDIGRLRVEAGISD